MFGTAIPYSSQSLNDQNTNTDVNDDFFKELFEPPKFLIIHRIYQVFCFVIFGGPIKLILSFIVFLIWMMALKLLPMFERFFSPKSNFKKWSHQITKRIIRVFLLCLGIAQIKINGRIDEDARFFISNHISFIDYLIYSYALPLTFLQYTKKVSSHIGQRDCQSLEFEQSMIGNLFDVYHLSLKKNKIAYQLANFASDPSYFPLLIFPEVCPTNGEAIAGFSKEFFEIEDTQQFTDYFSQSPYFLYQPVSLQYKLYFTPPGFNCLYSGNVIGLMIEILSIPFLTCSLTFTKKPINKIEKLTASKFAERCQLKVANKLRTMAISKNYPIQLEQKTH